MASDKEKKEVAVPVPLDSNHDSPNPLGLAEAELAVLDAQVDIPKTDLGYKAVFRFATPVDIVVMLLSSVCAMAAGTTLPLMTVVFGSLTGQFTSFTPSLEALQSFLDSINHMLLYFVYIGVTSIVTTSLTVMGFTWTGERITKRLRAAYLDAILRQNIAFFDSVGAGEVGTRIADDTKLVQDGISQKVGLTIVGISSFAAAEIIAFIISWRLALVMLSVPIAIAAWMGGLARKINKAQLGAMDAYGSSATFAEEAISSARDVMAYNTRHRFSAKYDASLDPAMALDFRAKSVLGAFIGGLMWAMLAAFALCSWAGARFMDAGYATVSQIVTVLLASVTASITLGSVAPNLNAFGAAAGSANRLFSVLERKSPIPLDSAGREPEGPVEGHVRFRDVTLVYPSRRGQFVLEDFNLDIPAGKTTAIVGPSGSGKSSVFGLLERLYSPLRGQITIDGRDITELSLPWLRSQIRMVAQESFIFNATVFENIAFGLAGTRHESADHDAKLDLVREAARIANAHAFIVDLPQGYDTVLGEGGSLLSGGQRQRIGIARAVVSNPTVLLLDEATAALDSESESAIQKALLAATQGRTTVTVAHRLSTIRHADTIVVLEHGKIAELGTHDGLLEKGGTYASLVSAQKLDAGVARPSAGASSAVLGGDEKETSDEASAETDIEAPSAPKSVKKETTTSRFALFWFIWNLNRQEQNYMILGIAASFFCGLAYPISAILFGNTVLGLRDPSQTLGGLSIGFWTGMQLLLSCLVLVAYVVQGVPFAYASSRLVARARRVAFAAILRQDMAFFAQNDSGTLTAFLSVQANRLNGLSGSILGSVAAALFAVFGGLVVAVSFGWKLGLIAASLMPLTIVTGYLRYRLLAEFETKILGDTKATSIVLEAVRGIRTVVAFGLQPDVSARYKAQLEKELHSGASWDISMAVFYGLSQSVVILNSALLFWYGGTRLIATGEYGVREFLICYVATIYSAQSAGSIFSHAPDVAGAQEAATRLKALMETIPAIDAASESGDSAEDIAGNVELSNVDFAYPSQAHLALRHVSLQARSGQFVAFVGGSGSGKSSILNLLERFYDPRAGHVLADGKPLPAYNLQQYRKQIAVVAQEASLYSGTVRENILSDVDADDAAIEHACRQANIWDFIQSLPDGLSTHVGPRGSQVSGGQKQRLAIAKALLRKPKILLLDEATSALDSKAEAAVQTALDAATQGRTTIAVAHRLSSIAGVDYVYVFEAGAVVERGSPQDLLARRGRYWEFVQLQNLGK
ncbi:multidrug resistance protein-like protein 1 [Lasiosphaeria miniovina]|uniref:Multidrug resistance protein-like protein 1 n=1 Tax=Lasiosphaeria miniovina TaxID=1954250 RepID=A0AA39ZUF1_9PEZI|nr:multidrug resistance protein-like protein 1 [Lasiosphaeria miniovina]KAK0703921.1 multidrug resistance protein-like protein 1 [Lasiosphaeria miniovina]